MKSDEKLSVKDRYKENKGTYGNGSSIFPRKFNTPGPSRRGSSMYLPSPVASSDQCYLKDAATVSAFLMFPAQQIESYTLATIRKM